MRQSLSHNYYILLGNYKLTLMMLMII